MILCIDSSQYRVSSSLSLLSCISFASNTTISNTTTDNNKRYSINPSILKLAQKQRLIAVSFVNGIYHTQGHYEHEHQSYNCHYYYHYYR